MAKQSRKYTILGGIKVSSKQLSKWGSLGGRPAKYSSNAERQRAKRLREKQKRLGAEAKLESRKTYGKVQIKRFITCPQCGKVNHDLKQYFNEKGEYMPETWWWNPERGKHNIKENLYCCVNCSYAFSFVREEIKPKETKTITKKAGSSTERSQRFRSKK